MQQEIKDIADSLLSEAEKVAGDVAKSWSDDDRKMLAGAAFAVAQFGVFAKLHPDQAETIKPVAESVIERLKSIGTKESGDAVSKFFAGALKVLEIAVPIIVKIVLPI